jgi:GNAT superfamily N-acetyltransferase
MKQDICSWIQLADTMTVTYTGYYIRSISAEKTGDGETLFVDAAYRKAGIGTALVTWGLAWMDSPATVRKRISAWAFYRKSGFYPRMTLLEQKTDPD